MKITGSTSPMISLQEIFEQTLRRQSVKIIYSTKHVLHNEFQLLPSDRRYITPPCRLNRYKYSFVPLSIKQLNSTATVSLVVPSITSNVYAMYIMSIYLFYCVFIIIIIILMSHYLLICRFYRMVLCVYCSHVCSYPRQISQFY